MMHNIEIRENRVVFEENGAKKSFGKDEYDGEITEDNVEDVIEEVY